MITNTVYTQESQNVTKYFSNKYGSEEKREIYDIDLTGSNLYLSDYYNGLLIYDLSEIFNPVYLDIIEFYLLSSCAIRDDRAFLCANRAGLSIYDISEPGDPLKIGEWKDENTAAQRIGFNGNVAVIGTSFDSSVVTLDIQDLEEINELGRLDLGARVYDLAVKDTCAYAACLSSGLIMVDISNPALPRAIDTLNYGLLSVSVYENYLLIPATCYGRVDIYDISEPHNPQMISSVPTSAGMIHKVYIDNNFLYILLGNGFEIYDVEDITNPIKIGYYYNPDVYSTSLLAKDQFIFYCARDLASGDDYLSQGDIFEIFHNESFEGSVTPPFAVNDTLTTIEDSVIAFTSSDLLENDFDLERDLLTIISIDTSGMIGTLDYNLAGSDLTYNPMANYYGDDFFSYILSDGNGGLDTASVDISITPVDDKPVAVDDILTVNEDSTVTIYVLSNDVEVDGDQLLIQSIDTTGTVGHVNINQGNLTLTYTPIPDYFGSDTLHYTITDGHVGGSDTADVIVTVTSINDLPVAVDDNFSTAEDTSLTILISELLSNDTDTETETLLLQSIITTNTTGLVIIDPGDSSITYTPAADFNGDDSFIYIISDGSGGTDTATVQITVTPINDAPLPFELTYPVNEATVDSTLVTFKWQTSVDPDFDEVNYNFYLSGTEKDTVVYDISDTVLVFDGNTFLEADKAYTWNVKATDGTDTTSCEAECQLRTALVLVGIDDKLTGLPRNYSLSQNYPNPFNPSTTINYELPKESFVKLVVYNILGERITTLVNEQNKAGRYEVKFNAKNVPSGVYLYRIQAGEFINTKKMLMLK